MILTAEQATSIAQKVEEWEAEEVRIEQRDELGGITFLLTSDQGRCRSRFYAAENGALS